MVKWFLEQLKASFGPAVGWTTAGITTFSSSSDIAYSVSDLSSLDARLEVPITIVLREAHARARPDLKIVLVLFHYTESVIQTMTGSTVYTAEFCTRQSVT